MIAYIDIMNYIAIMSDRYCMYASFLERGDNGGSFRNHVLVDERDYTSSICRITRIMKHHKLALLQEQLLFCFAFYTMTFLNEYYICLFRETA